MYNKIFKIEKENLKITLKALRLNDVNENYLNWFKDKKIKKFISFKPQNLEDLKKNVSKFITNKKIFFFAIIVNKVHIGNIKVDNINFLEKKATLGILIGNKKFRNKGIGFSVINFVIKHLNKLGILYVYLGCNKNNHEALSLYLKSGFKVVKKNKQNLLLLNTFLSNKFILGTVQFNSVYGITNFKKKKISSNEEKKILKLAFKSGIQEIDTAETYSFDLLRNKKILKDISINTKLLTSEELISYKILREKFLNYKKNNLKINTVFIHDGDNLFSSKGLQLLRYLKKLKNENLIKQIGISIYNFNIINRLNKKNKINIIQLPYNLIDTRLNKFNKKLSKLDIEVQARSIFLQGAMLTKVRQNKELSLMHDYLKDYAKKNKENLYDICINHVFSNESINKIVIGVRSLKEIKTLINAKLKQKKYRFAINYQLKKKVINPSLWS